MVGILVSLDCHSRIPDYFFEFITFFQLQFTSNIILYWIQVYRFMVRQSYNLHSAPLHMSSVQLEPHTGITVLLTVFPLLASTSP